MSHLDAIAQHAFCVADKLQHLYYCIWQPGQAILVGHTRLLSLVQIK